MFKVKDNKLEKIVKTGFELEGKLEGDLESWVENNPSILGEDLLIIGRQVQIPEVKDKIDLLAMDVNGNTVIIELKRGEIKDPVDVQSLKYASYVSGWEYDKLKEQARVYYLERNEKDFNFNNKYETFVSDAGVEAEQIPEDFNREQRIIIAGSHIGEKLGSVALWLRNHHIDIKIVEFSLFKDGDNYFLSSQIIIPPPAISGGDIGKRPIIGRPWINNGQAWHLEERCGKAMKEKLIQLNNLINENIEEVDGPFWGQKFYVSFKVENHIWLTVDTSKNSLILTFNVKAGIMNARQVSSELGVKLFEGSLTRSEKVQLESSIEVYPQGEHDRVRLRIKEKFNLSSESFRKFIKNCFLSFKESLN